MGRQGPLHPRGGPGSPHRWRGGGPVEHRMHRVSEGATRHRFHGTGRHGGVREDHRSGCQGLEPHRTGPGAEAQQGGNGGIATAVHQALQQLPLYPHQCALPEQQPDAADALNKDRVIKVGGGQAHCLGSRWSSRSRPWRHMAASPSAREIRGAHPVASDSLRESSTLAATSKRRSGR